MGKEEAIPNVEARHALKGGASVLRLLSGFGESKALNG